MSLEVLIGGVRTIAEKVYAAGRRPMKNVKPPQPCSTGVSLYVENAWLNVKHCFTDQKTTYHNSQPYNPPNVSPP